MFFFQFFDVEILATLPPKLENLVKITLKKNQNFQNFRFKKKANLHSQKKKNTALHSFNIHLHVLYYTLT